MNGVRFTLLLFALVAGTAAAKTDTISCQRAAIFSLALPFAANGYVWEVADSGAGLVKYAGSQFIAGSRRLDGESGSQLFTFRAIARGRCILSFIYIQPFRRGRSSQFKKRTFYIIIT